MSNGNFKLTWDDPKGFKNLLGLRLREKKVIELLSIAINPKGLTPKMERLEVFLDQVFNHWF